eukprot:TRINITY_DN6334_c0_g2_i1.p1 TRINITY_DN6334_c0_g2~~TRINITY_DN6334_c0_g2_i1.p1  ORF type:complete len:453 (-),score=90.17 TRINITY_DN6334_c0_g2_i1:24-1382(-)
MSEKRFPDLYDDNTRRPHLLTFNNYFGPSNLNSLWKTQKHTSALDLYAAGAPDYKKLRFKGYLTENKGVTLSLQKSGGDDGLLGSDDEGGKLVKPIDRKVSSRLKFDNFMPDSAPRVHQSSAEKDKIGAKAKFDPAIFAGRKKETIVVVASGSEVTRKVSEAASQGRNEAVLQKQNEVAGPQQTQSVVTSRKSIEKGKTTMAPQEENEPKVHTNHREKEKMAEKRLPVLEESFQAVQPKVNGIVGRAQSNSAVLVEKRNEEATSRHPNENDTAVQVNRLNDKPPGQETRRNDQPPVQDTRKAEQKPMQRNEKEVSKTPPRNILHKKIPMSSEKVVIVHPIVELREMPAEPQDIDSRRSNQESIQKPRRFERDEDYYADPPPRLSATKIPVRSVWMDDGPDDVLIDREYNEYYGRATPGKLLPGNQLNYRERPTKPLGRTAQNRSRPRTPYDK